MLGGLPGFVPVGELRYLWSGGVAGNELCGCGLPFHSCPFWAEVGARAYGGWDAVDVEEMLALERAIFGRKRVPFLLAPGLWPPYRDQVRRYVARIERLYEAIQDVSGCRYIVDSTKDPPYGLLLQRLPGVGLHLVHLVRDSRATAFAWTKQKIRPEVASRTACLPRYGLTASVCLWMGGNLMLDLMRPKSVPRHLTRYESLARAPKQEVEELLDALGCGSDGYDLALLERRQVRMGDCHTIRGNPVRFEPGYQQIQPDDEWMQTMPPLRRIAATLMTWPLLLRYGYLAHPGRR